MCVRVCEIKLKSSKLHKDVESSRYLKWNLVSKWNMQQQRVKQREREKTKRRKTFIIKEFHTHIHQYTQHWGAGSKAGNRGKEAHEKIKPKRQTTKKVGNLMRKAKKTSLLCECRYEVCVRDVCVCVCARCVCVCLCCVVLSIFSAASATSSSSFVSVHSSRTQQVDQNGIIWIV